MRNLILIIVLAAVLWQAILILNLIVISVNEKYQLYKLKMTKEHFQLAFGDEVQGQSISIAAAIVAILVSLYIVSN